MILGIAEALGEIGRHIGEQHVIGDVGHQNHANADAQCTPIFVDDLFEGHHRTIFDGIAVFFFQCFKLLCEGRRFLRGMAKIKPDQAERGGKIERNTPAPIEKVLFSNHCAEEHDETSTKHKARNRAEIQPATEKAATTVGSIFCNENRSARIFAAYGKTLCQLAKQQ